MRGLPFDMSDIEDQFDYIDLERGRSYWKRGRVVKLDMRETADGFTITSEVRGTVPRPYKTRILIKENAEIYASCSCPVDHMCKHAAATMLEALIGIEAGGRQSYPDAIVIPGVAKKLPEDPLTRWIEQMAQEETPKPQTGQVERILYVLQPCPDADRPKDTRVRIVVARVLKHGAYSKPRDYSAAQLRENHAHFVTEDDAVIGRLIYNASNYYSQISERLPDDPETVDLLLKRIIGTGRAFLNEIKDSPLRPGNQLSGRLGWKLQMNGSQAPAIIADDDNADRFLVLPSAQPWYVDTATMETGRLAIEASPSLVKRFLSGPVIGGADIAAAAEKISYHHFSTAITPPKKVLLEKRASVPPVPCLRLVQCSADMAGASWHYAALLHFDYDGIESDPASPVMELRKREEEKLIVISRHMASERKFQAGLARIEHFLPQPYAQPEAPRRICFGFPPDGEERSRWLDFIHHDIPRLREQGWSIDIDVSFAERFRVASLDNGDIEANMHAQEGSAWWFSLDLGILVEGQRVPLLPLLVQSISRLRGTAQDVESLAINGTVYADLPDGRAVALPFERIRDILFTLVELFDRAPLNPDGTLPVSIDVAAAFARIEAATRMRWLGGKRLRELVERLRNFSGISPVKPPAGLKAILRPYQKDGLAWLQFLREYGLGGILADDMGLGKTVQALAHFLVEKESGRMDRPCLVICPTSVIPNWQDEATRFAPGLRVLSLHGKYRAGRFSDIKDADLVLTTYPLLPRDIEHIKPIEWHMVLLDEAQAIKNPTSKATQLSCELKARHRICMTGTPVENHLGEAWAHFAFLLPGMLGDAKRFTRLFRTPIEKQGNIIRQELLAQRLKPFILRRLKADVAQELPPKTEILRHVEMESAQRDLYETMRLAMHEKVQQAVAENGLNRSHIIILDALLKLRQVCCDPRLVKLAAAKKVRNSAKLESLLDMLPGMIEDGRKILLFSQFTSMLDLIRPELDRAGIKFVELRGDTKDRRTPVKHFQSGKVPLFIISLKAGGTGLNLTAADTVIHYDPWWNPAVEAQATDRAHRIGQDKPVFVYKMITSGTIEERIMEMQNRKRAIAAAILDQSGASAAAITQKDLDFLFSEAA